MTLFKKTVFAATALSSLCLMTACNSPDLETSEVSVWPTLAVPTLDPAIEARVDDIMARMSLEQKVGQIIQADTESVTLEDVKKYRLGSILSGGNSAPGDLPYAAAEEWLAAADAYFDASIETDGVEVAIPIIWGIDAVHGHANLHGATVFPHNIGLGAAGNPDLIEKIMEITALELVASGHDWTFAPTLAVPRDDRWGRTYEGFSENPEIVASYADRIVYGLQGRPNTKEYFDTSSVISSAKHFVGDGGTTNGVDQGDTAVSEEEMATIHAAGYYPALEAGVQTVMASFNSWNGEKMHGHKYMLTDVLKEKLGFNGFVIGDWNGHGQIPGCTNTDCPQALLAGVDMYMAPDSWKELYHSTLAYVQDETIPMERLDDAVRRILRVKITSGLFEKERPSKRLNAKDNGSIGLKEHRDIARQAVRESLVLLKNNNNTLPLKPDLKVLVVGDGADSIAKQSGGWTLSWQGGGYRNADFPNGQSILSGIKEVVEAAGGEVIFSEDGLTDIQPDAVIAVYGEDPYAEFHGDLDHLKFNANGFDTSLLATYNAADIPVVSVFLSGRPLWANPEINASDAFVAAWLPGTEGGGIADVLFRTKSDYDFKGRLSFSWPKLATDFQLNIGGNNYDPLFPVGYGLNYLSATPVLEQLSEVSGLDESLLNSSAVVFRKGASVSPWNTYVISQNDSAIFNGTGANVSGLSATRTDHLAQEDALLLSFASKTSKLMFLPEGNAVDWNTELSEGKSLSFAIKSASAADLKVEIGCVGADKCAATYNIKIDTGDWSEVSIPLSCLADGVNSEALAKGLLISTSSEVILGLADIRLTNPSVENTLCK